MMEPAVYRVQVDESRVDRAIAELWSALAGQNVAYSRRFERGIFSPLSQQRLRALALALCAIGLALSCYILASVPVGCGSFTFGLLCFAAFGLLGFSFYHMTDIQQSLRVRSRRWVGKVLRRRADKTLGPMRSALPVEIEYTFADDQVRGQWLRDGQPERNWKRKLDRFAYVGEAVCAIFAKKSSHHPRVVILHTDRERIAAMLEARGVEIAELPREIPEEYGPVGV